MITEIVGKPSPGQGWIVAPMKMAKAVEAMKNVQYSGKAEFALRVRQDIDALSRESKDDCKRHLDSLKRDGTIRIILRERHNAQYNRMDYVWKELDFSGGQCVVDFETAKRVLSCREYALVIEEVGASQRVKASPSAPLTPDQQSLLATMAAQIDELQRRLSAAESAPVVADPAPDVEPEPVAGEPESDQPQPLPPRKRRK